MNRVFIKTYGCQMNERDSEAVAAMLRARGYRIVASEDDCDVLLLNTCSVRDAAEQKAIGKAGYAQKRKRRNPDFILGILGCMAQNRGAGLLDSLPDVDLIVGTQKFHRVPGYLDNLLAARAAGAPVGETVVDIAEEAGSQNTIRDHLESAEPQVTAFVSIQQRCDMACSFCIVPKTRGDERSRPIGEIVDECRGLAARGVRDITLLGQIVTSYGRGLQAPGQAGGSAFVRLLEEVHAIEGVKRIRFTSPHPRGFKPDLVAAYGRLPKLCDFVHLPMQSGSNRILRAMNRPYTRERYLEIVRALRDVRPGITLSTDVIVGFPGETDADFEETRSLRHGLCLQVLRPLRDPGGDHAGSGAGRREGAAQPGAARAAPGKLASQEPIAAGDGGGGPGRGPGPLRAQAHGPDRREQDRGLRGRPRPGRLPGQAADNPGKREHALWRLDG